MRLERLKKRSDFVKVAALGRKVVMKTMIVQSLFDSDIKVSDCDIRVGFTASRRVGNAVMRNRAKRRLRTLVDSYLLPVKKKPVDIVFIARQSIIGASFSMLRSDFFDGLNRLGVKDNVDFHCN